MPAEIYKVWRCGDGHLFQARDDDAPDWRPVCKRCTAERAGASRPFMELAEVTPVDLLTNVAGECPMGCGGTLFLGHGGHVTCSWLACPRPTAADDLLHLPTEHIVIFDDRGWTLEHPARERVEGTMHGCAVHEALRDLSGAPVRPGRYVVSGDGQKPLVFTEVSDA